jgi:hypothetical protein
MYLYVPLEDEGNGEASKQPSIVHVLPAASSALRVGPSMKKAGSAGCIR